MTTIAAGGPGRTFLHAGLALILFGILLSGPHPAAAHGYIIRVIPASGAVLERSPARLQAWFSENLEPRFSTLSLADDKGNPIELVESGVSPGNPAQLTARLGAPLPDGAYTMSMRVAFASDGHVFNERIVFWVGHKSDALAGAGPEGLRGANALEVVWRAITLPALAVLFGALLLYHVVLLPGWRNPAYPAGGLPPRVIARLRALLWAAIIAAGLGSILALFQQSMTFLNSDIGSVLRTGSWQIVLNGTQIGETLKLRLVLIALAGGFLVAATEMVNRQPQFVTSFLTVCLVVAGTALGTLSVSSHAAGATLWPAWAVLADWLHLLANSAWVGGLVALAVILPMALRPLETGQRTEALLAVMRRFSVVGIVCVALMATTGLFSALIQVPQAQDLGRTAYGQTLVVKILLIVPLLLIGLVNFLTLTRGPLAAFAARSGFSGRVAMLAANARLEAGLGLGVLLAAIVLSATPPPVPPQEWLGTGRSAEASTQTVSVNDLAVRLSVDPGASGPNSYEVTVSRGGKLVEAAHVQVRFVYPALDKRTGVLPLDDAGGGGYLGAGVELDRAGEWQILVDVQTVNAASPGDAIRAAFRFQVPESAPSVNTRQPNPLNWLSGGLILAALGVWPGLPAVRWLQRVQLHREIAIIGVAAGIAAVLLLTLGGYLLAEAERRADSLRNPAPEIVNPALADANSLARGRGLYEAQCLSCHGPAGAGDGPGAPGKLADLRGVLQNRRDEDLNRTIVHGVGTMPRLGLTDAERWDVINYLRSQVFAPPSGAHR